MLDDIDDAADWFSHIQHRIRTAKSERELKLAGTLLDGHHFMALPERCQEDLIEQYAAKLMNFEAGLAG